MSDKNPFHRERLTPAETALLEVQDAESPALFAQRVAQLLQCLAQDAHAAQAECETSWQDPQAGRPWGWLAKDLERFAETLGRRDKL